jgi:hypothetical protein
LHGRRCNGNVAGVLDDDDLCGHGVDALELRRGRPDEPLAGVMVCRDCGAELRIWSANPPSVDAPTHA